MNVVVQTSSIDPAVGCLPAPVTTLGFVAAHSEAEIPVPVRFGVATAADRASTGRTEFDEFTASLALSVTADQFSVPVPQTLDLELISTRPPRWGHRPSRRASRASATSSS
jgi:hypothetical protein